jgi:hypothetical protein
MTLRTYADLQSLLGDNTSGDITPSVIRDVVQSLSISRALLDDRVTTEQTISVVGTYEDLAVTALIGDIDNSESVTFGTDGDFQIADAGLYDVVFIVGLDLTSLSNNDEVHIQLWSSEDDITFVPFSAEESFIVTPQDDIGFIRLATRQTIVAVPKYYKPRIRSSSTAAFDLTLVYISVDSLPVLRVNP